FIKHRREVVTRRTVYLLRKARERGHILEGLAVAIANIDPVITMIKSSQTTAEARENLIATGWDSKSVLSMLERAGEGACKPEDLGEEFGFRDDGKYYLSPVQAQNILDMRLQKLTGLEHDKLLTEYEEKLEQIAEYLEILGSSQRLLEVIREEIEAIRAEFSDARRTEIIASQMDLTVEDLITEEDRVVTISHGGYAKTQPLSDYQAQRRGGKGKSATAVKDEDFVEHLLVASTHDTILCFTNAGKVYWLKVFHIPVASRQARGRPIVNLLPLEEGERITSILPIREYEEDKFVFMATQRGIVKKTALTNFARQRSSGLIAIRLDEGDALVATSITDGSNDALLVSSSGKMTRFKEELVRQLGRSSRGMKGITLEAEHRLIALIIPAENGKVLTVSERGYGKRTEVTEFPAKGRGGKGVIGMQCSERNGELVGAVQVFDGDEIMLISNQGTMVRTGTEEISLVSRNTQGVRLIKVADNEKIIGLERIEEPDEVVLEDEEETVDGVDAPVASADDAAAKDGADDATSEDAE
ncbi:MAG: DNA gyrase subunit A, partial [Sinobacterium sp.]|nr:DNA gyrase subunit A [Sinobacterium sp.]